MKKITLEREVFIALHDTILKQFKSENADYNAPEYQLYGYNQESGDINSIRQAILRKYQSEQKPLPEELMTEIGDISYNGKYLRDALKVKLKKSEKSLIVLSRAYLDTYLFYIAFSLEEFLKHLARTNSVSEEALSSQWRLIGKSPPSYSAHESLSMTFRCYYYSHTSRIVESFILRIEGANATITHSPAGKSYEGKLDQHKKSIYNQSITLVSKKSENIKAEVHILFSGRTALSKRYFSTGFISVASDIDYFSGVLIAENEAINQTLELVKQHKSDAEPIPFNQLPDFFEWCRALAKKNIQPADKQAVLDFFGQEEERMITELIKRFDSSRTSYDINQLVNTILKLKYRGYSFFLRGKEIIAEHINLSSYHGFLTRLDSHAPGWKSNIQLQSKLAGWYHMFTSLQENSNQISVERMTAELTEDGKFNCRTPDEGEFQGVYRILEQRVLEVHLKKVDGPSNYHLVLEIPRDINWLEDGSRILCGIGGGLSKDLKPRADKVMLAGCRQKEIPPSPKYLNTSIDKEQIQHYKKAIPDFKKFFSLKAKDNYLQGSNILFSYLIDLPEPQCPTGIEGSYQYYRMNISGDTIKKYPFYVDGNGVTTLYRQGVQMSGKAFCYQQRVVILFYGNGQHGVDGCLFMKKIDQGSAYSQGLLMSFSYADEPFCDVLFIQKIEGTEEQNYQSIKLNTLYSHLQEEETDENAFYLALDVLLSKNYNLFIPRRNLIQMNNIRQQQYREKIKVKNLSKQAEKMVMAYLQHNQSHFEQILDIAISCLGFSKHDLLNQAQLAYPALNDAQLGEMGKWIDEHSHQDSAAPPNMPSSYSSVP